MCFVFKFCSSASGMMQQNKVRSIESTKQKRDKNETEKKKHKSTQKNKKIPEQAQLAFIWAR